MVAALRLSSHAEFIPKQKYGHSAILSSLWYILCVITLIGEAVGENELYIFSKLELVALLLPAYKNLEERIACHLFSFTTFYFDI